jgi:hypothetical protein
LPNYSGMTVNERRYEARLMDAFDEVVRTRQRAKVIELLISVDINLLKPSKRPISSWRGRPIRKFQAGRNTPLARLMHN